jgi:hypothetical protein
MTRTDIFWGEMPIALLAVFASTRFTQSHTDRDPIGPPLGPAEPQPLPPPGFPPQ